MKQIFINNFSKGSQENPNLGISSMVGFDLYSKKGTVKLSKKSTLATGFTAAPTFIETSGAGSYIWAQCENKSVLYSTDGGNNWTATDLTTMTDTGHGNGLIFFQNYMIAFTDHKVYFWKDTGTASGGNPTAGAWVDWTSTASHTGGDLGTLQAFGTDPIQSIHFPYLYANNRGVYFACSTLACKFLIIF